MTLVPEKRRRKQQALDTRQKIINCCIELFNHNGIQNVTLRDVASAMSVSLGNLTYHFPRKKDLIHATLEELRDRMTVALARPDEAAVSFQAGVEYLIRVYSVLWEFRFYFNSLRVLIKDDETLRNEYYEFRDWLLDTMETVLIYLQRQGLWKKPEHPNTFRLQSENIWRLWLAWLKMYQLDNPASNGSTNAALYDCAIHHWSFSQGWLLPEYSERLLEAFKQLLCDNQTGRSD